MSENETETTHLCCGQIMEQKVFKEGLFFECVHCKTIIPISRISNKSHDLKTGDSLLIQGKAKKLKAIYWCDSHPDLPETKEEINRFSSLENHIDLENIEIVCSFDTERRDFDVLLYDFGGLTMGASFLTEENGKDFINAAKETPSKWFCVVSAFTAQMVKEFARELDLYQDETSLLANLFYDVTEFRETLDAMR
jgi:hypothetical protein